MGKALAFDPSKKPKDETNTAAAKAVVEVIENTPALFMMSGGDKEVAEKSAAQILKSKKRKRSESECTHLCLTVCTQRRSCCVQANVKRSRTTKRAAALSTQLTVAWRKRVRSRTLASVFARCVLTLQCLALEHGDPTDAKDAKEEQSKTAEELTREFWVRARSRIQSARNHALLRLNWDRRWSPNSCHTTTMSSRTQNSVQKKSCAKLSHGYRTGLRAFNSKRCTCLKPTLTTQ